MKPSKSEANTRRKLIDPKLEAAGWKAHDWQIDWEYPITDGRIHFDGKVGRRGTPKRADYLLRYAPSVGIAVVEAKPEADHHLEGASQAKEYAKKLGLWFAYATNGIEIEFFNLKTGKQEAVKQFHRPEELWQMYLEYWKRRFETRPLLHVCSRHSSHVCSFKHGQLSSAREWLRPSLALHKLRARAFSEAA